jgi:hypothetical protein
VSFFAPLPPWRPPTDYRVPVWARGPVGMLPGVVPVALLVARTGTHAVLVDNLLVYPTGFDFAEPCPSGPWLRKPGFDELGRRRYLTG